MPTLPKSDRTTEVVGQPGLDAHERAFKVKAKKAGGVEVTAIVGVEHEESDPDYFCFVARTRSTDGDTIREHRVTIPIDALASGMHDIDTAVALLRNTAAEYLSDSVNFRREVAGRADVKKVKKAVPAPTLPPLPQPEPCPKSSA